MLGANDGLTSNLALVLGVAGAQLPSSAILITGLTGLLAGACSMAIGEWVSVQSARELYQRQVRTEAAEIRSVPDEEEEELALIYEAKGLPQSEAQQVAKRLIADEDAALDAMVREELGLDPATLGGSPYSAGASSFALFAVGAFVPLIPYFFAGGTTGIAWSLAASVAALGAIGLATSLFSGRGPLYSAIRQVLVGAAAAAITYATGALIGVSLS